MELRLSYILTTSKYFLRPDNFQLGLLALYVAAISTAWPLLGLRCTIYIYIHIYHHHHHHHQYSALEAGLAGIRVQSCDRYGSGTLHPGQVLGGSLPLLSPTFRLSTFAARCLYVRNDAKDPSSERQNCGREICPVILPKFRLPRKFRDLLHAANLRHGTDGFTSPPKEGVLRVSSS